MDDSSAIQKRLAGDWESFRHLVEKYQGSAVRHALAIVGNREDALDAVQEAFFDAFQALGGFDNEYIKIEETIAPVALRTIGDWILKRTATQK